LSPRTADAHNEPTARAAFRLRRNVLMGDQMDFLAGTAADF
jgi:hypothetical protein